MVYEQPFFPTFGIEALGLRRENGGVSQCRAIVLDHTDYRLSSITDIGSVNANLAHYSYFIAAEEQASKIMSGE